jgi:hypothetical protein
MMRWMHAFVILGVLLFWMVGPADAFLSAAAKITIKVVDESGAPVEGARVGAGFKTVRTANGTVSTNVVKVTGVDGVFVGKESCDGHIGWNIKKDGYYETRGGFGFNKKSVFRWLPWNPVVTSVLRKIENPVPMYIRDTRDKRLKIPEVEKDIGFDLMKCDWVHPYGGGEKSDFIFNLKRRYVSRTNYDFQLKIKFSNENDGIQKVTTNGNQGSLFLLSREAPLGGYEKNILLFVTWNPGEPPKTTWRSDNNYIFRIRSKREKNALSGIYGKIIGGIEIGRMRQGTAYLRFKYYLNPDGSRNLEHDPNRNLFMERTPEGDWHF